MQKKEQQPQRHGVSYPGWTLEQTVNIETMMHTTQIATRIEHGMKHHEKTLRTSHWRAHDDPVTSRTQRSRVRHAVRPPCWAPIIHTKAS